MVIRTEAGNDLYLSSVLSGGQQTITGSFTADGVDFHLGATGWNYWGTVDNLVVATPGTDTTDATNGGYWEYEFPNDKIWIEWFSGKNDLFITPQPTGASIINVTPTDNRIPLRDAYQFRQVYSSGGKVGPTIQLGYGGYYCSEIDPFDRSLCIQGMGNAYYTRAGQTHLVVGAGKRGILTPSFFTDNASAPII